MANGSFTKQVGNRSNIANEYIKVWWTAEPDVENNRSKVRVYAKMYRPWYLHVDFNQDIELWINGEKFTASRYGWRGQGWTKAYIDKTIWVPHKADGTKTINIRLRTEVRAWLRSWVGWVDTGDIKCKLDNITRKSKFTLSDLTLTLGEAVKVNLSRSSSKVRHTITLKVGDYSKVILYKADDNGTTSSYSHTLSPSAILPYMSGKSKQAKIEVKTWYGSKSLGTNSKTFTIKIRSTDKPSLASDDVVLTPVPISPNTSTKYFINGKSKLKIAINPTKAGGDAGKIKTYYVKINKNAEKKYTKSTITTDNALSGSGTYTVKVRVVDGRGMESNTITKTFTSLAYSKPSVTNFSVVRCNQDGTTNNNGEYIKTSFKYKFSKCEGVNSATVTMSVKDVDDTVYSTLKTWSYDSSSSASNSVSYKFTDVYPLESSFDFKLTIKDAFNATSTQYNDVNTEEMLLDIAPKGVGIGKIVEREKALEVGWDAWFEGTIYGTVQANTSDIRKKLLVGDSLLPLLKIWDELSVVLFKYRDADDKKLLGLVAQDVISIFNAHELDWRDYGLVYEDPATGYYSINYEFINQLSMLKVKTLQSQICELASRITKLEK